MNNFLWKSRMYKHPFHIVDSRPWPLTGSLGGLYLLSGLAGWMNKFVTTPLIMLGLLILVLTLIQWWRDICRESTLQGKHTSKVESGLRIGIVFFICREVCLFFTFFWAFFHSSLRPSIYWPPSGVSPINPYGVPLLNTSLLLSRGATLTWTHIAIINSKTNEAKIGFIWTVFLGLLFTVIQVMEYIYCPFTISDSVYGSIFFVSTGFHGAHVIIGTIFISVIWVRHTVGHLSQHHHLGFEASAWYWHFVDVVWLFLFLCVYWWGY